MNLPAAPTFNYGRDILDVPAAMLILGYDLSMSDSDPGVSFLLVDLDLANTFLDIADSTELAETRERNISNAWTAHNSITNFASRIHLTDSERLTITSGLQTLRNG